MDIHLKSVFRERLHFLGWALIASLLPLSSALAAVIVPDASGNCPSPSQPGVLTACTQTNFPDYLNAILKEAFPLVLLAALVMIIYSGVQYMSSGMSAEWAKSAKQRIAGIITGVVFYFLIQVLLNSLGPCLNGSTGSTATQCLSTSGATTGTTGTPTGTTGGTTTSSTSTSTGSTGTSTTP